MADATSRIANFRKMAGDDPDNELGHFSLGRALMDAGQFDEAIKSFRRTLEINPNLSKVYQLLGGAMLNTGQKDQAIELLTKGVQVADARGDLLPRNDMTQMLKDLGAPVPQVKSSAAPAQAGEGEVLCSRCGRVAPKMSSQPFSSAQGKLIYEHVCAPCWREWIGMGTKVINELRLPLNDPQAQKVFDQHMMEFLNLKDVKG